jgi:hypothetical protein
MTPEFASSSLPMRLICPDIGVRAHLCPLSRQKLENLSPFSQVKSKLPEHGIVFDDPVRIQITPEFFHITGFIQ